MQESAQLHRASEVVGSDVVAYDTRRLLGRVTDLLVAPRAGRVLGLLVDGGWLRRGRVLPVTAIRSIIPEVVIVPSEDVLRDARPPAIRLCDLLARPPTVRTTDRRDLGRLADLFFADESGRIEGYEVAHRILPGGLSGRTFVPAPANFRITRRVALVPPATAALLEDHAAAIREALGPNAR